MKDYYVILGVTRDSSEEEIRKRYRQLAMQYHPDQNPDTPGAEEKFKEIAEAYGVLTDPVKRREYDACGAGQHENFQNGNKGAGFSYSQEDILRDLFNDPHFQQMFKGLLREFQRSGFRANSDFVKRSFFGGKGGFFLGGIFLFGSLAGPTLLKSAKKKSLSGKSSAIKSIGKTIGSIFGNKIEGSSSQGKGADTNYKTVLTSIELEQGKMIQLVLNGEQGKEVLRVIVPAGSKNGQKLRVRGKGQNGALGRGDLFLCLEEK